MYMEWNFKFKECKRGHMQDFLATLPKHSSIIPTILKGNESFQKSKFLYWAFNISYVLFEDLSEIW